MSGVWQNLGYTREQWFALPLRVRQRWWDETRYGAIPPSEDLKSIIAAVLNES